MQSGQVGDGLIERLVAAKVPLLVIGRPFHQLGISFIDVDNAEGAYNATSHLMRFGHRRAWRRSPGPPTALRASTARQVISRRTPSAAGSWTPA